MAAAGIGDHLRGLRLGAAAAAAQGSLGVDLTAIAVWTELLDRYLGSARAAVGAQAAADAERDGAALELDRAVEEGLVQGRS